MVKPINIVYKLTFENDNFKGKIVDRICLKRLSGEESKYYVFSLDFIIFHVENNQCQCGWQRKLFISF
jgi:transcription elongation factor GreA-like protein